MKLKLQEQYKILCRQLGGEPRRIWLPVGSGTLARIFSEILPNSCEIVCLNVRILPPGDSRLEHLKSMPNLKMIEAPELFHEQAEETPPCPSNRHYDAKLWQFIRARGAHGDVWWNVAR
jgi:hypothetical protein